MAEHLGHPCVDPNKPKPRQFNLEFSDLCYDDFDCKVTVDKGTDANVAPYEKIRVIEISAFNKEKELKDKAIDIAIALSFEHNRHVQQIDSLEDENLKRYLSGNRQKKRMKKLRDIAKRLAKCTRLALDAFEKNHAIDWAELEAALEEWEKIKK